MFNEIENLQYENKEIKFYTPTKKTAGRVSKIFRKEPITITWMSNIKENEIIERDTEQENKQQLKACQDTFNIMNKNRYQVTQDPTETDIVLKFVTLV